MKRLFFLTVLLTLTGCMEPLYESDYPLYRQYKYWETSDKDWQEMDSFRILVRRTHTGERTELRLETHRDGLPSTAMENFIFRSSRLFHEKRLNGRKRGGGAL